MTGAPLTTQYGRCSYRRRIAAMLARAGLATGGAEGPQKQREKGRLWLADGSCIRLRPTHPRIKGVSRARIKSPP